MQLSAPFLTECKVARTIHYSDETYNPDLYYRLADGRVFPLIPGSIEGLTDEIITVIRETNEIEHTSDLNERYVEDPRFKRIRELQEAFEDGEGDDDIPRFGTTFIVAENYSNAPEHILFPEQVESSDFMQKIRTLIPLLNQNHQRLYNLIKEGLSLSKIAEIEGTTKNAIASRGKKMKARLLSLYAERYAD